MQTLATGTWTNSPRHRSTGFTLVEILVVLVIIGIMIAGAVLSIYTASSDSSLDKERDRMLAVMGYLRDQGALQNRELGIRCFDGGYEFLVYNAREDLWGKIEDDALTQVRKLPKGIELTLAIEGRKVALPKEEIEEVERLPQILLYSSGEMNLFELKLEREGGRAVTLKPGANSDDIQVTEIAADPT